jgi:hypothetical protein
MSPTRCEERSIQFYEGRAQLDSGQGLLESISSLRLLPLLVHKATLRNPTRSPVSLSNVQRADRNIQVESKKPAIVALYQQAKTDEEIASQLDLDVTAVRVARDGMFLPPHHSASGRLFNPEVDAQLLDLRDRKGHAFRQIGTSLGYTSTDVQVRYRILKRLQERKAAASRQCTIPCMLCHRPFVSADRRRIRFCEPCRLDEVPALTTSSYDPECASGCGTFMPAQPVSGFSLATRIETEVGI